MFVQFIQNVVGSNPALTVKGPWSSVLYVDNVRGSDVTGTRGDDNLPFATIQAALNAMLTDDVVDLGPQTFATTAPLTVPASVIRGGCYGLEPGGLRLTSNGLGKTQISNLSGAAIWDFGANLGLTGFNLGYMNLSATGLSVAADGSSYAQNTFLASSGLTLDHVNMGSITAKYAFRVTLSAVSSNSAFSFSQCRLVALTAVLAPNIACLTSWDLSDPLVTGQGSLSINMGSVIGGSGAPSIVTMTGQAQLIVDQTSTIGGLKASGLNVSGASVPGVICDGYIAAGNGGVIDFAAAGSELPDTATALTFNFKGTRFYANNGGNNNGPTLARFKVGGAAGNFQTVVLDAIVATPTCTFTADAKIHLTMRGAVAPQAVYTTPGADGDIIPPAINGTIDISAGGAVAKTWVNLGYAGLIRTGVAPTTCLVTSGAALADAFVPNAGKAVTGFTITSIAAAGNVANWEARF